MSRYAAVVGSLLGLAGCATTPPVDLTGADTGLTPAEAAAEPQNATGRRVAWGGTIVGTRNLKERTELEVLGYPLDGSGRPQLGGAAEHRFLVVRDGYLESADYRPGRLVTAIGELEGTRQGQVGEVAYTYPVLHARQLYLWPLRDEPRRNPNIHFGIGIGVILR